MKFYVDSTPTTPQMCPFAKFIRYESNYPICQFKCSEQKNLQGAEFSLYACDLNDNKQCKYCIPVILEPPAPTPPEIRVIHENFSLKDIKTNDNKIANYLIKVIKQMKKQGATKNDYNLLSIELICNAIKNNRKPEDVAWAILQ